MKQKKKNSRKASWLSSTRNKVLTVVMVFGLLGAGYYAFQAFALSDSVDYYGTLNKDKPTASYKLTTGAGDMRVEFSNNTADLVLTVVNSKGDQVGSLASIGKKNVYLNVSVLPDTYVIKLTPVKNASLTKTRGFHFTVWYPKQDTVKPTAVITSPQSADNLKGSVSVAANASDDTTVKEVGFFINDSKFSSDTSSPYAASLDTTKYPDGVYNLSVRAYDNASNVGEATMQVSIKNAVATVPTSTQRFPGDPNPIKTGKAYWGAGIGGNASPSEYEGATGTSLSIRRTFWQWSNATDLNSGMYKTVGDDLAANRLPFISIKPPSWSDVGAGKYDAQLDAMLRKLDSYGKPVWLASHHEPEGGGGVNSPDDPGGAPAWRAMQTKIRERMNAVGTKNIAFMPVMMAWTADPASGRNINDWWVPGIWDAYIFDHYVDSESSPSVMDRVWNNAMKFVESKGIPTGTAEWGNRGTDATAANEMQSFWDWSFNNKKDVVSYTYFDSSLNAPSGSWELVGEPLKKFEDIMKNDKRVQRVNGLK